MSEVQATKICGVCKISKLRTEFHKNRARYDGLQPECKECVAAYHRRPDVLARQAERLRKARQAGKYKEWDYAYNRSAKGKLSAIKYRESENGKKRLAE